MNIFILIIHVQNIYVQFWFLLKAYTLKVLFRSLVCPVGYLGPKCEKICRYPSYGSGCQMKCDCTQEFCNNVHGCNDTTIERKIHVTLLLIQYLKLFFLKNFTLKRYVHCVLFETNSAKFICFGN